MVTREINSLWKTFNFFYRDCSSKNAFCIAQQFKIRGLTSSYVLAHCIAFNFAIAFRIHSIPAVYKLYMEKVQNK